MEILKWKRPHQNETRGQLAKVVFLVDGGCGSGGNGGIGGGGGGGGGGGVLQC
jgi:hypothetical protein